MNIEFSDEVRKLLFDPIMGKIVGLIVCIIIIYVISKSTKRLVIGKVQDTALRYKVKKLISFISFLLVLFSAGFIFSDKLAGLTVAFGVAGAGIAFALQEVITSIAGWFAINFKGFFKVGDRVQLGGIKGDVIDIGVLRTTLMEMGDWVKGDLYNGRTVRISNSFVFKDPVFNYSAEYPFVWDEIDIMIRHESDEVEAESIISRSAETIVGEFERSSKEQWGHMVKKFMIEDARVKNFISLSIDGNGLTFTLRYITDFKSRRKTKDALFREINDGFKKSNGSVEWAVSTLELSSRPALEVNVKP